MKFVLGVVLALSSFSSFASGANISEEIAVLIARAYVVGSKYAVGGSLEEELYKADKITDATFEFSVLDVSGDCALHLVVTKSGAIDEAHTKTTCN